MAKKQPNKPGKPFWEPFGKEAPQKSKPKKKHVERASRRKKIRSKREEEEFQKRERAALGPQAWEEQYLIRLNRFMGQAGVCARREADKLIAAGKVKVNGKVVKEMGTKINARKDIVEYEGKKLKPQNLVYYLYNKPKNTLTTNKDDRGRTTVIDQIEGKTSERVYPIGRLDRNTTGLLLLTNDGKLAKKLTDSNQKVRNLYHVRLDKPFEEEHFQVLLKGVKLEDGVAAAEKISYVQGEDLNHIGIEIQMIRNRVVSSMFAALGYKVIGLDRVSIAHLTKKRLPRGQWRALTEQEVSFLKMV